MSRREEEALLRGRLPAEIQLDTLLTALSLYGFIDDLVSEQSNDWSSAALNAWALLEAALAKAGYADLSTTANLKAAHTAGHISYIPHGVVRAVNDLKHRNLYTLELCRSIISWALVMIVQLHINANLKSTQKNKTTDYRTPIVSLGGNVGIFYCDDCQAAGLCANCGGTGYSKEKFCSKCGIKDGDFDPLDGSVHFLDCQWCARAFCEKCEDWAFDYSWERPSFRSHGGVEQETSEEYEKRIAKWKEAYGPYLPWACSECFEKDPSKLVIAKKKARLRVALL